MCRDYPDNACKKKVEERAAAGLVLFAATRFILLWNNGTTCMNLCKADPGFEMAYQSVRLS
jgi:hypothetical protein